MRKKSNVWTARFFFSKVLGKGQNSSALSFSLVKAKHHMSFNQEPQYWNRICSHICVRACVCCLQNCFNHILNVCPTLSDTRCCCQPQSWPQTDMWCFLLQTLANLPTHLHYIPSQIHCSDWWVKGVRQRCTSHANSKEKLKPQVRHEFFFPFFIQHLHLYIFHVDTSTHEFTPLLLYFLTYQCAGIFFELKKEADSLLHRKK